MAEIKIMVVPGKIARVELTAGMTVLDACEAAGRQIPGVDWVGLAKNREVRVQNRKFSNTAEVLAGCHGSISATTLNDGEVILILTKIKGNVAPGLGVLTVTIDGQEYALETPEQLSVVLANVAGYDLRQVRAVFINGEGSPLDQLVGSGDFVVVKFYGDDEEETPAEDEDEEEYLLELDSEEPEEEFEEEFEHVELPPEEPEQEYLLSVAEEASEAVAPVPQPQVAELDPGQLDDEAKRLQAQAYALANLAQAIRQVNAAKTKLAELGYKF